MNVKPSSKVLFSWSGDQRSNAEFIVEAFKATGSGRLVVLFKKSRHAPVHERVAQRIHELEPRAELVAVGGEGVSWDPYVWSACIGPVRAAIERWAVQAPPPARAVLRILDDRGTSAQRGALRTALSEQLPEADLRRLAINSAEVETLDGLSAHEAVRQPRALAWDDEHQLERCRNLFDDQVVLLTGETGTGKTVLAKKIAKLWRPNGPFRALDCSTLTAELVGSELFGHERGSFTGATKKKDGLFKVANKGVLFLDEIGELPPPLQSSLLTVLDSGDRGSAEREFRPVGAIDSVKSDVRLICATNRDLRDSSAFRRDLLARISAVGIEIPSLREQRCFQEIHGCFTALARKHKVTFHRRAEVKLRGWIESPDCLWLLNWRDVHNSAGRLISSARSRQLVTEELVDQEIEYLRDFWRSLENPAALARPEPGREKRDQLIARIGAARCDELLVHERLLAEEAFDALVSSGNNRAKAWQVLVGRGFARPASNASQQLARLFESLGLGELAAK